METIPYHETRGLTNYLKGPEISDGNSNGMRFSVRKFPETVSEWRLLFQWNFQWNFLDKWNCSTSLQGNGSVLAIPFDPKFRDIRAGRWAILYFFSEMLPPEAWLATNGTQILVLPFSRKKIPEMNRTI